MTAGGVTFASVDGGLAMVHDGPSTESAWVPLIPRTLCVALAGREVPEWFRSSAGLPDGAGLEGLRRVRAVSDLNVRRERIRLNLCDLLAAGWSEVREVRVIDRPWPAGLDPRSVDWPTRVRRGLVTSGLIDDRDWLSQLTYGRLVALTAIGMRSVFDFAVTAEAAVDQAYNGVEPPRELIELARHAAKSTWAGQISGQDPRFRDLLGSDRRTLAERLERALGPASDLRPDDWLGLAWALPEIFDRVERIEQIPLELALREYVEGLHGLDGGSLDALLARLGLDGQPPCLLSVAASRTKLSPERIRVLQARLEARLPSHPVYLPALDRALALLVGAAPCALGEGEALLRASGIATVPFRPESVLSAAWLCGRKAGFELEQTARGQRIVLDRTPQYGQLLVRVAAVRAAAFGAASLTGLIGAAAGRGISVTESRARDVLDHQAEAEFLDDDWFWLPRRSQNRLATLTRRILAVASPLDVDTLRAGISRSYGAREAPLLPPQHVLGAFYRAHPDFRVDRHARVRPAGRAQQESALSRSDRILLDVFRATQDGFLDRASLRAACVERGMNKRTFHALVAHSPLLDDLGGNLWCLRGARTSRLTATQASAAPLAPTTSA